MMDPPEVDLERLRWDGERLALFKGKGSEPSKHRPQNFLKGPVPLGWLRAAGGLPGKALHVGIVLWFRFGMLRSQMIPFSYKSAQQFRVDRHAAYRALKSLGGAGLVAVCRAPGRCPIVTLLIGDETAKDPQSGGARVSRKNVTCVGGFWKKWAL